MKIKKVNEMNDDIKVGDLVLRDGHEELIVTPKLLANLGNVANKNIVKIRDAKDLQSNIDNESKEFDDNISPTQASPTPWSFEWEDYPVIKDANGKVVATLSTGEVSGAYSEEQILANAMLILKYQPIKKWN